MENAPTRRLTVKVTTLYLVALSFRIPNAWLSRTYFQPDEYWQSLEVAHRIVFGYGYRTWEWRTLDGQGGIRSPLYPLMFVPVYEALRFFQLDKTKLLMLAPRLLQATLAACADVATARLAGQLFGPRVINVALFCSLASFFNAHASTRTFSNSTETALTAIALALWPWEGLSSAQPNEFTSKLPISFIGALVLAALAGLLRPSNIVIWIVLGMNLLVKTSDNRQRFLIISNVALIGALAAMACFLVDTAYYGFPTFTPYTFLIQNVVNSVSLFYGANPFHFYVTQALPFMTMTMLPFVTHGLLMSRNASSKVKLARNVVAFTIAAYSLLGHKEFRFIHPLLPLLNAFAATSLFHLYRSKDSPSNFLSVRRSHTIFVLLGLVPAVYLTSFHSVGQDTVMDALRVLPSSELRSVAFLMPCHSTPWMSHLHREDLGGGGTGGEGGRAWFITCEPPILGQNVSNYRDQSDFFYDDPLSYLHTRFPPSVDPSFPPSPSPASYLLVKNYDLGWKHTWPSHIVLFEALLPQVKEVLEDRGYRQEKRIWNSHWHEDERRRGDVIILRWYERPVSRDSYRHDLTGRQ